MTKPTFLAIQHARAIRAALAVAPLHRGRILRGWMVARCLGASAW